VTIERVRKKKKHKHRHRKTDQKTDEDGFHHPSKVSKHKKSNGEMTESDSLGDISPATEKGQSALAETSSEHASEAHSDEAHSDDSHNEEKGTDEKTVSAEEKTGQSESGGKEKSLSKRLAGARKGLFNSLTHRSWRKSRAPNAHMSEDSGDLAAEGSDGQEPAEGTDAVDSPNTSSTRRNKYKNLFSKHSKKDDDDDLEANITFTVKRVDQDGEEGDSESVGHKTSVSSDPANDDNDDDDPVVKEEKMRKRVLREIIETEESYVNDLHVIVDVIIVNMQKKNILNQSEISGLFSGIEVLLNFNSFLLEKLKKGEPVGKSFEAIASFMKGYVQYCVNVPKAEERLKQYAKDSNFRVFLTELSAIPEMHQLGVGDFLMKPVQRLCKYPLLLRELISHTPKDNPDYPNLNNALNQLQKTVTAVNEGKRIDEDHQKVVTIFNKLDGFDDRAKFITPSRRFIYEATLTELLANGTEQEMYYFFFNDCIVRCKQHTGRYTLKSFITQDVLLVTPVSLPLQTRKVANAGKPLFLLDIVQAGVDKFTIVCDSEQERSRLFDIASGNVKSSSQAASGLNSTKELMEMYGLQPKTKPPPSVTDPDPPGIVVFSVSGPPPPSSSSLSPSSSGENIRFVSIDKDKHTWKDVVDRVSLKFGLKLTVESFVLCKHGNSTASVTKIEDLCNIITECTAIPQFDLIIKSSEVGTSP